ncbi:MAG: hypothetical protein E6767_04155 [Dysgonomonas sp.]|nr:hypothetical protein [Dysgonomonas sp.]
MNELNLNYGTTKTQKTTNIVLSVYFIAFGLFIGISQVIIKSYGIVFIGALICVVFAALILLRNTVWLPVPILKIDNEGIASQLFGKKSEKVEWVNVSKVNIGPGYIIFFVNGGQKQKNLDLSELKYNDITKVKSKIIELCEYKNIPYHND